MLRERGDMCVNKEVRIDQNHRQASSSAAANTSATSSRLPTRQRPSETLLVRMGFLGRAGGAKISLSPCRIASLTTVLRLALRTFWARFKSAATSLSRLKVVRIHQSIL